MDKLLQEMEFVLQRAQTPIQKVDAMNQLAWRLQNYDVALAQQMANESRRIAQAQTPTYAQGIALSLVVQARLNYLNTRYELAINQSRRALDMLESIGCEVGKPDAYGTIGLGYRRIGIYHEALEAHLAEYAHADALDDDSKRASACNNIGLAHTFSGDYDSGKPYFENSQVLFHELGDTLGESMALNNLGEGELRMAGRLEDAISYFQATLDLCETLPNPLVQFVALNGLSMAYIELGDLDTAEANLNTILENTQRQSLLFFRVMALRSRGRVYMRSERFDHALRDLHETLLLAERAQIVYTVIDCHESLAEIYKQLGDFERAYHHMERFHTLYKTTHNSKTNIRMRNLEVVHRTRLAAERASLMEMRAQEQENLRLQDRQYFEKLAKIKDELMDTASHDLKNPLATIITSSYLLRKHLPTDDLRMRYVEQIETSARRMRDLIKSLLDLAQIETGRAIAYAQVDIKALVDSVIDDFAAHMQRKALKLVRRPPDDMVIAMMDAQQMRRVLENLVSNAVKYTPSGGSITITLETADDMLSLTIADTGIGIPEDALPYIFDRFYRVANDEAVASVEGNGLGLSIVKSIVEQHGGSIHVESDMQGSRFIMTLPLNPTHNPSDTQTHPRVVNTGKS